MLSFTFHKADGRITPGDYLVYAELKGTSSSGTISATAPFTLLPDNLPGDVNGDEKVDLLDLIRFAVSSGEAHEIREEALTWTGTAQSARRIWSSSASSW